VLKEEVSFVKDIIGQQEDKKTAGHNILPKPDLQQMLNKSVP